MNDFLSDFIGMLRVEKGVSHHTIAAYKTDIQKFLVFLGEITLQEVTEEKVIDFLNHLKKNHFASASILRHLAALKSFFKFLKKEGHLTENITQSLQSPKIWQLIPEVLTIAEVDRLLAFPSTETFLDTRDLAILEVLYGTGIRVSELCGLNIKDVADCEIRVLGKGNKERIIPLGKKASGAIDHYLNYLNQEEEALFRTTKGKRIDRIAVWRMIKERARRFNIQKNISPHTLRHSFATHLLENDAPIRVIQEMLGHATLATTERYTHINQKQLNESFVKCHPKFDN